MPQDNLCTIHNRDPQHFNTTNFTISQYHNIGDSERPCITNRLHQLFNVYFSLFNPSALLLSDKICFLNDIFSRITRPTVHKKQ